MSAPRKAVAPPRAPVKAIAGAGGGGGIFGKAAGGYEAPDTLQSDQTVRMIDLLSEGEIEGFATPSAPLQSIYLNGVPIQNGDGSYNFNGLSLVYTSGTPDQAPLPGFPDVETTFQVGTQILAGVPIVNAVTDPDADRCIVTLELPALYLVDSNGNVNDNSVGIEIWVQPNGGSYAVAIADTISGKSSSTYEVSYSVPLTGSAPWNVKVQRTSADSLSVDNQNLTYWAAYTVVQDFQLIYPDSALVGIEADAQLFGTNIPTRTYLLKGIKVQIPSNYNPTTRVYTGVWDGTFVTGWTNNPAWIFYDLIVNNRYGLGQYVDASLVDIYGLYAIAQYCDELVPDGAGGQEPRYTFNGVIAKQEDAIRVLVTFASVFRGMVFWGPGGVMTSADMPSDPVRLITPANVVNGEITYSGAGLRTRHTVAYVTWWNPALAYAEDVLVVPIDQVVPGCNDIQTFGWRPISFTAFGCTSRGQAYRMGAWLLYTEKFESETATWTGGFDQADLVPGDLVLIADPAYAGVRFGGRAADFTLNGSGQVTGVTLDAPVTLESGQTYTLSIVYPDLTIGTAGVTNAAGETSALSLNTPLSQVPVVNAIWVLTASNVAPLQYRIIARVDKGKNEFDFTALYNDPTKYAQIEQGITLEPASYTTLPSGPLGAPTNASFKEGVTLVSGTVPQAQCVFSWTAPSDPRVVQYNVQSRPSGTTSWTGEGTVNGPSIDILGLTPGAYDFRVQALDAIGNVSAWLELDGATIVALSQTAYLTQALPDVGGLYSNFAAGFQNVYWTDVDDPLNRPNIVYEWRQASSGGSWDSALYLVTQAHPPFTPPGLGTYLVKAVSTPATGYTVYSADAAEIIISGNQLALNLLAGFDEKATNWQGTFQNGIGVSGPPFGAGNADIRLGGSANILAESVLLQSTTTTAATAAGGNTLTLASVSDVSVGQAVNNTTHATAIPGGTTVTEINGLVVTLSNEVASPGVSNGDTIVFCDPDVLASGGIITDTPLYYTIPASHIVKSNAVTNASVNATTQIIGVPAGQNILGITNIFNYPDILGSASSAFVAGWVEINVSQDGGTTWAGWQKFAPGVYPGNAWNFRLALESFDAAVIPFATAFNFTVQLPARIDHYQNQSVPSTGLTISFTPDGSATAQAFNGGPGSNDLPYVNVSWQAQSGDTYQITGLSLSQLTITFYNSSGVAVARNGVNIDVEGY